MLPCLFAPPRFVHALALVVAGALAGAAFQPLRAAAPATGAPHVQTLPNGLRVVIVENHAVPVVETAMWYGFGARDERPGQSGLAHALAHMMYRGTPSLSGAGLDDVFTQLGASEVATTANDFTEFHVVLPADKLELALRVEADRMQHLVLDDAAWKAEKPRLLAEHDDDLASPLARLYDATCRAASSVPLCALSPLGERADIAAASAQDLRGYYQENYAPNDATLVIAGDVDPPAALRLAGEAFGAIPRGPVPVRDERRPLFNRERQAEVTGDFPDEVVDLAYPAPGSADPDAGAFAVVDSAINNPRSDFYRGLVTSGYALGYSTQLDQSAHAGLFHVFLVVAPGHASAQTRDAFVEIMSTAQQNGLRPDLIAAAKTSAARQELYARDSIAGLANRVGYALAVAHLADPADGDARIANASANDVTVAARKYFDTPAATGLLTPVASRTGAASGPPKTSVSDDFSRRAPLGPIVEARWVRDQLATPSQAPTRATPSEFRLPNGLRVLVVPIHTNATVFVQGSVATSPRFDPAGRDGLGAMTSSLLAYGGTSYGFEALHRKADELGASLDLGFDFDAHARAQDLDAILDLLADDLSRPNFSRADLEHVRSQTLAAIVARDGDPDYRAGREFDRLLLAPADPTLRESTAASIGRISARDVHDYARRYVRPDATTITIVGDVDPATLRARVAAAFGSWTALGPRGDLRSDPIPRTRAAKRYVVDEGRVVRAHLGEAEPAHGSPDFYALDLIDVVLGADAAYDTRLMSELTLKHALAFSADSSLDVDRYRGNFNFRFIAKPGDASAASARVRAELERLQRDPIGPFELDRAKSKVVARARVAEESTQTIAERVERIGMDGLPLDYEATLPQKYGAVDGATILRVASTYLHPDQLIEVDEGPRP